MHWGEMRRWGQKSMVTRNRRQGRPGCSCRQGRSYEEGENTETAEAWRRSRELQVGMLMRLYESSPCFLVVLLVSRRLERFLFWQLSQLLRCALTANCKDGPY